MKQNDLTQGNIKSTLFFLSMPLIATSFLQMAYNAVDMIWIGRLSSDAVAAVGTAGFYLWFSEAFMLLGRTGTGIRVAQKIGEKDNESAKEYAQNGIIVSSTLGLLFALFVFIFARPLISIFGITDDYVINQAIIYLKICAPQFVFLFIASSFSAILSAKGNTKTPFRISTIGLITNIILDPLFIFTLDMGVAGAALATTISSLVVLLIYIYFHIKAQIFFDDLKILTKPNLHIIKDILKLGIPSAIYSGLFTITSIFVARIIARFGSDAIAIQKVGTMIESVSWLTAGGLAYALSSFVGQNYGAKLYDRVNKGYFESLKISVALGILSTLFLYFGADFLMKIFFPHDPNLVLLGADYLEILAFSQIFMCIEITTSGAFNGVGRTKPPAIISIVFNLLRIPMALLLCQPNMLGLNGVWYSISISSVFKGIILTALFIIYLNKQKKITATSQNI